jgi:hypothetical protein
MAKEKIFDRNKTVSEIAFELGFKYPQHSTRFFKQQLGLSLNEYRGSLNWTILQPGCINQNLLGIRAVFLLYPLRRMPLQSLMRLLVGWINSKIRIRCYGRL